MKGVQIRLLFRATLKWNTSIFMHPIYKGSLFCKYYSIHFFNCLLVLKCLYITSEKQLLMTFCFYYIYQFYLFFCSIFSLNKYFWLTLQACLNAIYNFKALHSLFHASLCWWECALMSVSSSYCTNVLFSPVGSCIFLLPHLSFRGVGGCSQIFKTKQEIAVTADRFTGQSGHLNRDASFHYQHDMCNFEVMSTIIHNPQEL